MTAHFLQGFLHTADFPDRYSLAIRLSIVGIKEKLHGVTTHLRIQEILRFYHDNKPLLQLDDPAHSPIKLSKIHKEQQRILELIYSCTTAFEPVNFDLSMFFVTSPPHSNQETHYDTPCAK